MSMFNWISDFFSDLSSDTGRSDIEASQINPATGLPMVGSGIGGVDAGGNPWGTDLDNHHRHDHDFHASEIWHSSIEWDHNHWAESSIGDRDHWSHTTSGGYDPSDNR